MTSEHDVLPPIGSTWIFNGLGYWSNVFKYENDNTIIMRVFSIYDNKYRGDYTISCKDFWDNGIPYETEKV